mgnify:CR=1 FL=1
MSKVSIGKHPIGLYYKGQNVFSTAISGIMTFMGFVLILWQMIVVLAQFLGRDNITVTQQQISFQNISKEYKQSSQQLISDLNPYIILENVKNQ